MFSALFAHMIMQQSNMAMMLLGKVPNPQTGETMRDFEGAQMFIDHLEMLEAKTRGNLSKEEDALLKQTLYGLRMTFVQAVDSAETKSPKDAAQPAPAAPAPAPDQKAPVADPAPATEPSAKKFTKKY
jgi:hypothetical protein